MYQPQKLHFGCVPHTYILFILWNSRLHLFLLILFHHMFAFVFCMFRINYWISKFPSRSIKYLPTDLRTLCNCLQMPPTCSCIITIIWWFIWQLLNTACLCWSTFSANTCSITLNWFYTVVMLLLLKVFVSTQRNVELFLPWTSFQTAKRFFEPVAVGESTAVWRAVKNEVN